VLKIWTWAYAGSAFNYTVSSSHQVSTGTPLESTPNSVIGQIEKSSTVYQTLFGVKNGDLVLVSISLTSENAAYRSSVYYPNMTVFQTITDSYGVTGSHSYQFMATQAGNYLLKFWTNADNSFNYTIRSSALLSGVVNPTSTPTPTVTPTPSPTDTPTPKPTAPSTPTPFATPTSPATNPPATIPPVKTFTGDTTTFQTSGGSSNATYIWDFGDGTTETTQGNNYKP